LVEATNINHNFKLESIIEAKTNLLENTQTYQTQFYISRTWQKWIQTCI